MTMIMMMMITMKMETWIECGKTKNENIYISGTRGHPLGSDLVHARDHPLLRPGGHRDLSAGTKSAP